MTGYVVTRWYRAPEVIFNWMHYSQTGNNITFLNANALSRSVCYNTTEYCGMMTKYYIFIIKILSVSPSRLTVDVWSAACILAEMITGSVLFPGHDSILALCCNKNCVCSISVARSSHCARLVSCLKYRTCWCSMVRHEGALHRFYPS